MMRAGRHLVAGSLLAFAALAAAALSQGSAAVRAQARSSAEAAQGLEGELSQIMFGDPCSVGTQAMAGPDAKARPACDPPAPAAPAPPAVAAALDLPPTGARPPQFVVVSFDGSGDAALMNYWRQIGHLYGARFTFFLSGVYLLGEESAAIYHPPMHRPGTSAIRFTNPRPGTTSAQAVAGILDQIHLALSEGHELGTHFNGHFCRPDPGSVDFWTAADWNQELDQFNSLLADAAPNNAITSTTGVDPSIVMGGRTPCLQGNKKVLYPVLAARGMRYDASQAGSEGQWPWKQDGIWSFPLALIPLDGTRKWVLSMDFNFYANQSQAHDAGDVASEGIEEQTLRSYQRYFHDTYEGDRAPISIGHHFTKWNHSAYLRALTTFISEVCPMPDVRCVSYRELVDWLDRNPPPPLPAKLETTRSLR